MAGCRARAGYVCGKLSVPLVAAEVEFEQECGPPLRLSLLELDLSSREAELEWLEGALGLKARSFRGTSWPILKEIEAAIGEHRASVGSRAGRRPHLGLSGTIRGQSLRFRNNIRGVKVLFPPADAIEVLEWLLQQFEADKGTAVNLQTLKVRSGRPSRKAPPDPEHGLDSLGVGGPEGRVRQCVLEDLRAHIGVHKAYWAESRQALQVVTLRGGSHVWSEAGVRGLKRRRGCEDPSEHLFEEPYRQAAAQVLAKAGLATGPSGSAAPAAELPAAAPAAQVSQESPAAGSSGVSGDSGDDAGASAADGSGERWS